MTEDNRKSWHAKKQLEKDLAELAQRKRENALAYIKEKDLYKPQLKFFADGADHKERVLLGANQSGKSYANCLELAFHLTGLYPKW